MCTLSARGKTEYFHVNKLNFVSNIYKIFTLLWATIFIHLLTNAFVKMFPAISSVRFAVMNCVVYNNLCIPEYTFCD